MGICHQDADFTLGGKDSAISCPVGVHLIRAVMLSITTFQRISCAICALSHKNNHPERVLLRDFKY
jgi:hypothetical protein